jgi:hypothetical protein
MTSTEPPGEQLPPAARERLAEQRARRSWGSTLTVSEFAAVAKLGFEPVGQVLGAAVYNIGDAGDEECPYGLAVYRGEGSPVYRAPGSLGFSARPAPIGAAAIGAAGRWYRCYTRRAGRP